MFGKKDCSNPSCLNEKLHIRHSHGKNTGYLLSQGETGLSTIAKVLPKALLLSSSGLIHFGKVRLKLPLTFIQFLFCVSTAPLRMYHVIREAELWFHSEIQRHTWRERTWITGKIWSLCLPDSLKHWFSLVFDKMKFQSRYLLDSIKFRKEVWGGLWQNPKPKSIAED